MDKNTMSIIQQKARGTYQRNEQIRQLYRDGSNYAEIGRWFKLTRQTIRKIANETGDNSKKTI